MTSLRRLRVPSILLLALVAALAFAATAAAETKVGEGTKASNPSLSGEYDFLKGTATYESSTGTATFTITTRAEAGSTPEGERESIEYIGGLVNVPAANCTEAGVKAEAASGHGYPLFGVLSGNFAAEPGQPQAVSIYQATAQSSESPEPPTFEPASKSMSGTTMTIFATNAKAINGPFACAEVGTERYNNAEEEEEENLVFFPIAVKVAPVVPAPTPPPAPTAAFSLAKIKPLKAKEGKWTKVSVKVTNTGNAAAGPIAIKAKAPKGVVLQPASGSLKLPALLAGQTWTVTFRVKLTAKAKKSSTIKLTTSSGAISAAGSFAIKLLG